jgi:thioredoxin-related protein
MRALLSASAALLLLLLASQGPGRAGLEVGSISTPAVEVVVFERPDCTYCLVFRRDVLPRYRDAVRAEAAPLRFVDITSGDSESLGLSTRIDTVPTAVVMRDGREVDRIVGYWGPTNFFKLLSGILTRME